MVYLFVSFIILEFESYVRSKHMSIIWKKNSEIYIIHIKLKFKLQKKFWLIIFLSLNAVSLINNLDCRIFFFVLLITLWSFKIMPWINNLDFRIFTFILACNQGRRRVLISMQTIWMKSWKRSMLLAHIKVWYIFFPFYISLWIIPCSKRVHRWLLKSKMCWILLSISRFST